MSTDLLRIERVKARTGLSRSEIYRRIAAQTFPKPIVIRGTRIRAWVSDELDAWLSQTIADSARLDDPQP